MKTLLNTVNLLSKSDYTFSDSLVVLVLGMFLIFAVLALLMGLLYLMPIVLNLIFRKKNKSNTQQTAQKQPIEVDQNEDEDEEIVAAIIAAITHVRQQENIQVPFVIRKMKRN